MSFIPPILYNSGSKICKTFRRGFVPSTLRLSRTLNQSQPVPETDEEGFRVLDLKQTKSSSISQRRKMQPQKVLPPRTDLMPLDQDWTNVWPGPRTFHPASVPLPIRQGVNKLGAAPGKFGNAELMKIPNFLHLTPDAIKKHCKAISKFCTPWPEALKTDSCCKKHFPLEVISSDYCHSSPTIRDPLSRIVTVQLPLEVLELDKRAKDKFLRLVGDRYDEKTGLITIVTDKCPLRQQNFDYALYLLTALYYESWKVEPWEAEKCEEDMEYYVWDRSKSKNNVEELLRGRNSKLTLDDIPVCSYKDAVVEIFEGENESTLQKYKEASEKLLAVC